MGHRRPRLTHVLPANRPKSHLQSRVVNCASLWFEPSTAHLDEAPLARGFVLVGGENGGLNQRRGTVSTWRRGVRPARAGNLTVEVEGDPVRVSICHCFAYQRRTRSVVQGAGTLAPRAGADWGLRDRVRADLR